MKRHVFITGATGYIGRRVASELVARGHAVRGLVRPGSESRAPSGIEVVAGDALDAASYRDAVRPCDTWVHLVGVAHPSPAKADQFLTVDLASVEAAMEAAAFAHVSHVVYVSVAHPAPVMRAYVEARRRGEARVVASGLPATILRPWYVLGPGHRWPIVLTPIYHLACLIPRWRAGAERLGLVSIDTMVRALVVCVEEPAPSTRVLDVPAIRTLGSRTSPGNRSPAGRGQAGVAPY